MLSSKQFLGMLLGLSHATSLQAAPGPHTDFEIGQDGSPARTLLIEGDADILSGAEPIELALQVGGPLDGLFVNNVPGWEGLEFDEPDEGLFALVAPHQVSLHRITATPGFAMADLFFSTVLDADGSSYLFSQDAEGRFHEDLFFIAPTIGEYSATLQLIDPSGTHAPSETFTLRFVAVPEPSALILTVGGALLAVKRRRPD